MCSPSFHGGATERHALSLTRKGRIENAPQTLALTLPIPSGLLKAELHGAFSRIAKTTGKGQGMSLLQRLRTMVRTTLADRHRWIIWIASLYAVAVLLIYFFAFRHQIALSLPPASEQWGQFGDYMSGTLNPFISLLTLWYLANSYMAQVKQMNTTIDQTRSLTLNVAVRESSALLIPELDRLYLLLRELEEIMAKREPIPQDLKRKILRSIQLVEALCTIPDLDGKSFQKLLRLVAVAMGSDERIGLLQETVNGLGYNDQSSIIILLHKAREQLNNIEGSL